MTKKEKKQHEARVERISSRAIDRIQINIFDLSKIGKKADEALARGESDETAIATVRAYALTIGKESL